MMLKSCCCCGLRNGALAVSIVFLTLSVLDMLGVLMAWGEVDAHWAHFDRMARIHDSLNETYHYNQPGRGVTLAIMIPCTLLALVLLFLDVLLFYGIRISSSKTGPARYCIVAWIIFRGVLFAIFSVASVGLLITAIVMRYTAQEIVSILFGNLFVTTAIISGFAWYSWVVVLSFYWQLLGDEAGGVTYNRIQLEARQAAAQPAAFGEAAGEADRNSGPWSA